MRKSLIVMGILLALAASACTKDDEPTPAPDASPSAGATAEIELEAGQYGYEAYGVTAVLEPKGGKWTLEVSNDSGYEVGAPALYALDARDGHQIDATVEGAEALKDGASETLQVTWPQDFDDKQIGMIVLLLGGDNYGALARG